MRLSNAGRLLASLTFLLVLGSLFARPLRAQDAIRLQATANKPYHHPIKMEGGLAPLNWQNSGDLPPGIQLTADGILDGTPTQARKDAYTFDVKVSDSSYPPQIVTLHYAFIVQAATLRSLEASDGAPPLKSTDTGDAPEKIQGSTAGGAAAQPAEDLCSKGAKPWIGAPLFENSKTVTVHTDEQANPTSVLVKVTEQGDPTKHETIIDAEKVGTAPANHVFTVTLDQALRAEQSVSAIQYCGDATGSESLPVAVEGVTTRVADFDFGRIRYYFSAGTVISKENDTFKNQDVFLGLNIDNNWYKSPRYSINTFFDARLTSIPVVAQPGMGSTSSSSGGSSGGGTAPSGVETFVGSRKAAILSGAIYLPIHIAAWSWWTVADDQHGNRNELFIAPMFKGGFQTLTGGATVSFSTSTGVGSQTTSSALGGRDFYHFYSFGFRLGHYKLYDSLNIAPELISYLDITAGKWENFENCISPNCTIDPTTGVVSGPLQQPWRLALEGRLKIPRVPLQIGFDANTRPGNGPGAGHGDLRFLFGTQFDIGCLFQKLKSQPNPQASAAAQGCGTDTKPTQAKPADVSKPAEPKPPGN